MGRQTNKSSLLQICVILLRPSNTTMQHNANTTRQILPCRLEKTCPVDIGKTIHVVDVLITMLILRAEMASSALYQRVLKRLTHVFCQAVEGPIVKVLSEDCPDPTAHSKAHPFQVSSRRKGSTALRHSSAQKFLARGGGFVSTRHELTLKALGMVRFTRLDNLTATEYCARHLGKITELPATNYAKCDGVELLKVINFNLDCARIFHQQVGFLVQIRG